LINLFTAFITRYKLVINTLLITDDFNYTHNPSIKLNENREEILKGYEDIIQALTNTSKLDKERVKLQNELDIVTEMLKKCVEENAHTAMNQGKYEGRYEALAARYENIKKEIEGINEKRLE